MDRVNNKFRLNSEKLFPIKHYAFLMRILINVINWKKLNNTNSANTNKLYNNKVNFI